ncbi:hypothetical protein [Nocardia sp. NPDC020380]|uniref:hypothetical protein n=1 Tax=Nocardia sp. NPDC020380 TaxID=3364309 RepID=UPI0037BBBE7C
MTFKIDPSSLANAAGLLKGLADGVNDTGQVPHLGASRAVAGMSGSAVSKAMAGADPASTQAKGVLQSRFDGFGSLLYSTAEQFKGTDTELAQRLGELGDLNSAG